MYGLSFSTFELPPTPKSAQNDVDASALVLRNAGGFLPVARSTCRILDGHHGGCSGLAGRGPIFTSTRSGPYVLKTSNTATGINPSAWSLAVHAIKVTQPFSRTPSPQLRTIPARATKDICALTSIPKRYAADSNGPVHKPLATARLVTHSSTATSVRSAAEHLATLRKTSIALCTSFSFVAISRASFAERASALHEILNTSASKHLSDIARCLTRVESAPTWAER
mmetsp:Transcript_8748/g.26286  ORF Transcript_8748/g.26286 Transcript_8748/m.26286 type:complete len:226 (+) Transcript_8748:2361-3038(+)